MRLRTKELSLTLLNKEPIECIRSTRRLMSMLQRLTLKTPNPGLKECKFYFDRCREKAGWRRGAK